MLEIITAPDSRLKLSAEPVVSVNEKIRFLMDQMLETMYAAPGVGLAAPQVGIAKRVIVADVARIGEERDPVRMANPEIVSVSQRYGVFEEGCLSLPGQYAEVKRPDSLRVRYLDYDNEIKEEEITGFLATCIQHEVDHLNGVLFVDHISTLKRGIILRKLAKQKKMEMVT